jgi:succinate dehydrogenase/fumarate reductase flavoprotein subunit
VTDWGSSLIDILVHRETVERDRRVFMDFTRNPTDPAGHEPFAIERLAPEAQVYLERSGAVQSMPIERLEIMNPAAIRVFRDHGADLRHAPIRIAVCAQHNNGGLRANEWWESSLRHLFPVGEVCGTHGVRRPGGAALNAGQVGAIRAGRHIAGQYPDDPPAMDAFRPMVEEQVVGCLDFGNRVCGETVKGNPLTPAAVLTEVQERMSECAAHVREPAAVTTALADAWALYRRIADDLRVSEARKLPLAFRAVDLCLTHAVYLEAIGCYLDAGGRSRGSVLVPAPTGDPLGAGLDERWRIARHESDARVERQILELQFRTAGRVEKTWVDVRPIPVGSGWFEQVWAEYRAGDVYAAPEEG